MPNFINALNFLIAYCKKFHYLLYIQCIKCCYLDNSLLFVSITFQFLCHLSLDIDEEKLQINF